LGVRLELRADDDDAVWGGAMRRRSGGMVTAPDFAFWNPDVEVEFDPKAWREGHDTQFARRW